MMRISSPLTSFIFLCGVLWGLSTQAQTKDPATILQLDTTTQGLLPPRMTTAQRDAIDSPPDGLTIYNTTTGSIEFYKGASSKWEATNTEQEYLPPLIHNNLVYIPLISKGTGEIWLDRNIGATQAPRSINDTGDAFGDFFIRPDAQVAGVCPPGYRLPTKAEWEAEMATFADNGGYHLGA